MAQKAEHEPKVQHHHAKAGARAQENAAPAPARAPLDERTFDRELRKLQRELVIMQEYVRPRA